MATSASFSFALPMLIANATPWICLTLALIWLAGASLMPSPPPAEPSVLQIVLSGFVTVLPLLSAVFLTAATVPRAEGRRTTPFAWARHVLVRDVVGPARRGRVWRAVGQGLAAGAMLTLAAVLLSGLCEAVAKACGLAAEPQQIVGVFLQCPPAKKVLLFVSLALVTPVVEELFFRYALESILSRALRAPGRALAWTAVIFAGMHGNGFAFLPLVAVSAGLSLVYRRAGSLAAPIVAHGFFNFASAGLMALGLTSG